MLSVKPAEMRSKQKEYFEKAYDGETIIVPRPKSRNVVILSEKKYNEIMQAIRILKYASLINTELTEGNSDNSQPIFSDEEVEKKMSAYLRMEKRKKEKPFPDDYDPKKVRAQAMEEKYGRFA